MSISSPLPQIAQKIREYIENHPYDFNDDRIASVMDFFIFPIRKVKARVRLRFPKVLWIWKTIWKVSAWTTTTQSLFWSAPFAICTKRELSMTACCLGRT